MYLNSRCKPWHPSFLRFAGVPVRPTPCAHFVTIRAGPSPIPAFVSVGLHGAKYWPPHRIGCLQDRNVFDAKVLVLRSHGIGSARQLRCIGLDLPDNAA